jgi:uncharacterized protein (TIGR01777 family)
MRVGITGGTGFLGSRLVREVKQRGDFPVVFTRTSHSGASTQGVEYRNWDALKPLSPGQLNDLDAVIHLAGESVLGVWTPKKKQRIHDVRVLGARHLVETMRKASPRLKVFLSSSASGYYGDAGDAVLTESSPRGTGFLAQLCEEWENEAARAKDYGARVVCLRTTLPLDSGGGILRGLLVPFRLGLGAVLGSGGQWMPWIHIDDWTRLVLHALDDANIQGPLNLTAPQPVRNAEFTATLAHVLHRPAILRVPAFVLERFPQGREGALVSQRILPAKAEATGFTFQHPQLEEALQHLLGRA